MSASSLPSERGQTWRWWVCCLLLLATMFNYMDRLTLNLLAPHIIADLHLDLDDYASIEAHCRSPPPSGLKMSKRPYSVSLVRSTRKMRLCSTCTLASGRPMRRWMMPPAAAMPPNRMATGMMAMVLWRARKDTRIPVKP